MAGTKLGRPTSPPLTSPQHGASVPVASLPVFPNRGLPSALWSEAAELHFGIHHKVGGRGTCPLAAAAWGSRLLVPARPVTSALPVPPQAAGEANVPGNTGTPSFTETLSWESGPHIHGLRVNNSICPLETSRLLPQLPKSVHT